MFFFGFRLFIRIGGRICISPTLDDEGDIFTDILERLCDPAFLV